MKIISELSGQIKGKKVLVRVDYNISIGEDGLVDQKDAERIEASFKTINFLKDQGARIILISHLGKNDASLKPIHRYLQDHYEVGFLPWTIESDVRSEIINNLPEGGIILMENLRQNPGEEANDFKFAKELSEMADYFVNDAFSASHRNHASIVMIPTILPAYAGFQFQKEFDNLNKFLNPPKPIAVVVGGVKFGTKLDLIKKYLDISDYIFVGGALAHAFFKAKGYEIGKSVIDDSAMVLDILDNPKIFLPSKVIVKDSNNKTKTVSSDCVKSDEQIVDIAPESIFEWSEKLKKCQAILWNGPMGYFEADYIDGTDTLAMQIAGIDNAFRVIGGGDTNSALYGSPALWSVDFVSLSGGAMLDFLVNGNLPGIEGLE